MHERGDEQRRVGHAPGDDHFGTAREGGQHFLGAEVGVGRDEGSVLRERRAARLDGAHRRLEQRERIVTTEHRDFNSQAELAGQGNDAASGAERIGGAHVGHDAEVVAQRERQQRAHARVEQRIEAAGGIGELAQLRERDGALGEAFEREVVELALRGEDYCRLEAIALEAAAGADANALIQAGCPPASRASPSARLRSG